MSRNGKETAARELIQAALAARELAYAPYSKFRVGAALLDEKDHLHTGCNIENASYGATCCAERTAIFKAVSQGSRQVRRLAVVCDQADYCLPCGICRQVMAEFAAPDFLLYAAAPDGRFLTFSLEQLLPAAFSLKKPAQPESPSL